MRATALFFCFVLGWGSLAPKLAFSAGKSEERRKEGGAERRVLRFGIVTQNISVSSPSDILIAMEPLTKYLSEKIGRPIRSQVYETHRQVIDLLSKRELEVGYVSDWEYIRVKDRIPDIEPLVRPRKADHDHLNVLMITRARDTVKSIYQLKGTRIACHNKASTASYLFPSILVQRVGYRGIEHFFSQVIKTKKQGNCLYAVAFRKADVAFVDDHVFDLICELKPKMRRAVRVRRLQNEGYPPIVYGPIFARKDLGASLKATLRRELVAMKETDATARQILLLFRIAGFVAASDADYGQLRKLVREYDAKTRKQK